MIKQEAREIQKELYGSTQDMQMRTTYSQLHPDIERAAPQSTAVSGTSGQTEGALFRSKCSITGGLLLLLSSFSVFTALIPRDALCTVTGKRYWNSERDDESMNAGCRCRTSHQAERQIQSGVWNRKTYLCETEGDTNFKRSLSVCAQQTLLRELLDASIKALPLQCKYLASPWLVVRTVRSSC